VTTEKEQYDERGTRKRRLNPLKSTVAVNLKRGKRTKGEQEKGGGALGGGDL